jgi:16S rRNA (guanine1516-N2)-methyltransferase
MPEQCLVALADSDASAVCDLGIFATQLSVPLLPLEHTPQDFCQFLLFYEDARLCLRSTSEGASGAVCVDFDSESLQYRQRRPVQPEALLKAAAVKQGHMTRVLDATAGFGLDAYLFAAAGSEVTMCERSKILHAMLADGIRRASQSVDERVRQTVARMHLLEGDSLMLMQGQWQERPEVIYLDPMFPERKKKSAKVKKNMFLLQQLLHGEEDAPGLLAQALGLAAKRVVVKRPRHAPFLDDRAPGFTLEGKSSRFDVYPIVKTGSS